MALGTEPGLQVYASAIANRRAAGGVLALDASIVQWIDDHVAVSDVLYEVGSGIGEYAVVAAKRKGAIVVGFEPGYAAHQEFCENVLLNRCEALIVPIPLALAGRDGLAEIKYLHGQPGEPGYLVRDDITWKVKHRGRNKPYLQPACLVRLDSFVEQQHPPSPHHLRIAMGVNVDAVLAGATQTLQSGSLKTICVSVASGDDQITMIRDLVGAGWTCRSQRASDVVHAVFAREP